LSFESENACWYEKDEHLICNACAGGRADDVEGQFLAVTRLQQYVHLLRVAHARLLATLKTSGALPHTSGKLSSGQGAAAGFPELLYQMIRTSTNTMPNRDAEHQS